MTPHNDATDLSGQVAVVTGAAAGLGRAEAIGLARAGATVVVNDIAGALDKSDVIDEITAAGSKAVAVAGDISERSTADELVETADGLGGLSIVVNNAGITRDRMLFNMSDEDWDAVIAVHLRGHFLLTRNAATYWRAKAKDAGGTDLRPHHQHLVGGGLVGPVGQANYGAAKAGITALTLTAARALGRYGVRANAIAPRARTAMTADVFGESPELAERPDRPAVARARREPGAVPGLARVARCQRTAVHRLRSNGDAGCGADGRAPVQCGIRCVGPVGAIENVAELLC